MKTKNISFALLIVAGVLSSTVSANAFTTYGNTVVNEVTYDLSPSADLTGANLSGATLTGAWLLYADLTGANLSGTELSDAMLYITNLTSADLSGAYLLRTTLQQANLTSADLTGADLTGANLQLANLTNAKLTGANLAGVNLFNATVSYLDWNDFSQNSGALGLDSYSYSTSQIIYAGPFTVPEPSTYGLIGIGALGVAFAARRRKLKKA